MTEQKKPRGGNSKSPNKRPGYYTHYYLTRYPVNKLKRIMRHNGLSAARSWASANDCTSIMLRLINQGVKVRE